jgi:heme exporter protein CcmD
VISILKQALGPHAIFILAAWVFALLMISALVLYAMRRERIMKRQLAALEAGAYQKGSPRDPS